ncbi:MAG: hypothetical protein GX934_14480 [Burkholderiales bacterium]|jgi:hypothetical protein|nr:hypothetical protein [Burkholderiales bacterium]
MPKQDGQGNPADTDPWKKLDREIPLFRLAQEQIFNLSESEEEFLEMLREGGLDFDILPRPDPTSFVILSVRLDQVTQRVEIEVNRGTPRTCSILTRRNAFADSLKGWLDRILGSEHFDARRYAASRRYVCYAYILSTRLPGADPSSDESCLRRSLFNFDTKERHFLELLEKAVTGPLRIQVYPRESPTGGLELMLCQGERRQPARVFVKGFYPVTYQVVTENTPSGWLLKEVVDRAVGAEHLEVESSRLKGRHLSLIYGVRHPRSILKLFEDSSSPTSSTRKRHET